MKRDKFIGSGDDFAFNVPDDEPVGFHAVAVEDAEHDKRKGQHAETFADSSRWWDRPLSMAEQRFTMAGGSDGLDAILDRTHKRADEQYVRALRRLQTNLFEWIAAPDVTPRGLLSRITKAGLELDAFEETVAQGALDSRKFGIDQAKRELLIAGAPSVNVPPDARPERQRFDQAGKVAPIDPYNLSNFEALTRAKSFQIRTGYEQKALQSIAEVLMNLNRQGVTGPEAQERLAQVFDQLAAGGLITTSGKKQDYTKPAVQQTIIRTMAASAFNSSRQDVFERNDNFVLGYMISEVDNGRAVNSHPLSKHLDSIKIKMSDPRARMLVPPNHYNDRAVQVSETVLDEPIEWSSDSEIDAALAWKRQLSPEFT